jgi:glycerate dehydrogenase
MSRPCSAVPARMVVLDGQAVTPLAPGDPNPGGEPTWDELAALGELTVHARTPREQVVERARGARILLTNKSLVGADAFAALPELRCISVLATGSNVVDLAAAARAGVVVSNVPGYAADSVAQHVFALLLALVEHLGAHDRAVHAGDWTRAPDFSFTVAPTVELAGRTLGIVGLGAIGRRVAQIGQAFGMRLVVTSRSRAEVPGVQLDWLPIDELFAVADVVTLHCPLTEATAQLVNEARLARMRPTSLLINTGRGPLVDEAALARALHEGRLAGAGLDVLRVEPPTADNPLLTAPRCLVTPHIGWATQAARGRLMAVTVENVRSFLAGRPIHVVA